MQLMKMVKHDIEEGIWVRRVYFLLAVLVSLVSCFSLHSKIVQQNQLNQMHGMGTVMDYWIYLVQGRKPYHFDLYVFFDVPARWMGLLIFLLISLNNYLLSDLKGWGVQALMRSKSRLNWWMSKVIWCWLYVLVYYGVCLFLTVLFAASNGAALSVHPSAEAMRFFVKESFLKCSELRLICIVLVQPVLLTGFLGMLQMLLSLCIKPIFAFVAVFTILMASVYWRSYLLPGNWGMPYRIAPIVKKGLLPSYCLILLIAGILVCLVAGYLIFRKRDVLEELV